MPFGVLLPVALPHLRGPLRVAPTTVVVTTAVEPVRGLAVPGRALDVDDVILNTGGALLGHLLLGRGLSRAVHPPRRRRWRRGARREHTGATTRSEGA